ncbi:MAG: hypothetical protein HY852_03200 [Bradyrhizobium sp.]|uniref:hypothetical protein n=1 Tax=Bradyrhizobium sp. TaxID=376 RepID=UPI0025C5DBE0|nr:hypothetical protein [Bradyrhizobium sp.]MBI5260809.1 hypothetical protein [Bradyrhizobium sp.]
MFAAVERLAVAVAAWLGPLLGGECLIRQRNKTFMQVNGDHLVAWTKWRNS